MHRDVAPQIPVPVADRRRLPAGIALAIGLAPAVLLAIAMLQPRFNDVRLMVIAALVALVQPAWAAWLGRISVDTVGDPVAFLPGAFVSGLLRLEGLG